MTTFPNSTEEGEGTSRPDAACACGPWWRLPVLLALVLIAILLLKGSGVRNQVSVSVEPAATATISKSATETVTLNIDFNDGHLPQSDKAPWHKGMTVRDLVNGIPRLNVSQQGTGASAFLTEIDGVKNEGANGRNWMYSVNDKRGDRSFAVYELQPGDRVLWSFAPPR